MVLFFDMVGRMLGGGNVGYIYIYADMDCVSTSVVFGLTRSTLVKGKRLMEWLETVYAKRIGDEVEGRREFNWRFF